jgi:hypothetical protein
MIDGDRSNIDKLGQIVFVRHIVAMPGDYIKGGMALRALEELAAELIDNFPASALDFVFGDWVQEVACICKTIGAQGTKFGERKVGAPDFWCELVAHSP